MAYGTRVALLAILLGYAAFLTGRDSFSQQSATQNPRDRTVQLKVGFVGSQVLGTKTVHRLAISLINKTQTDAKDVRLTIYHSESLVASTKWDQAPTTTDPQLTAWDVGRIPARHTLDIFADVTSESPIELEFVVESSDGKHEPWLIEIASPGKAQAAQPFVVKDGFAEITPSSTPVHQQKATGTLP